MKIITNSINMSNQNHILPKKAVSSNILPTAPRLLPSVSYYYFLKK